MGNYFWKLFCQMFQLMSFCVFSWVCLSFGGSYWYPKIWGICLTQYAKDHFTRDDIQPILSDFQST